MTRVNINILGISELKWTGMSEFNLDDYYINYCGQESLRRNGVALIVNKSLKCNTLATWCEEMTLWKRPWCWERLKAGGEGDNRGWEGWIASPTRWTWVWASSGHWWWTGKPSVLQSTGSQSWTRMSDWTILHILRHTDVELFNFSFFSVTGRGIDLDYRDTEWFALETNRDHSVVFETASKFCISDSCWLWWLLHFF